MFLNDLLQIIFFCNYKGINSSRQSQGGCWSVLTKSNIIHIIKQKGAKEKKMREEREKNVILLYITIRLID